VNLKLNEMEKITLINDKIVKIDGDYFIRHSKDYVRDLVKQAKLNKKRYKNKP
jgi:polyhydroxyalkanoate synthesis regulator phasin